MSVKGKSENFLPEGDGFDHRQFRRVPAHFTVEYAGRGSKGSGTVKDISLTGALVAQAEPALRPGEELSLYFSLFGNSLPVEIVGEVVRTTMDGFAVQFIQMNPRTRQVLGTAIAKSVAKQEDEGN